MGKLKIKFHPLFVLYVFLCIYFNWFNKIFYYVITVTLHEYGHYFVAKYFGYQIDSMIFSLSGAGITSNNNFKSKHDILISIAGPLVNLFILLITVCSWWIFPLTYLYTYDFLISNLVVMFFNLIPIYPLDGGRILFAFLSMKNISKSKLMKINKYVCLTFGITMIIFYIVSLFYISNLNLLFIGIFLTINSINCDKNIYFDKIQSLNKKMNKPVEVKVFKVNCENTKELIKYLNPHYYSIFQISVNNKSKTIEEKDLFN